MSHRTQGPFSHSLSKLPYGNIQNDQSLNILPFTFSFVSFPYNRCINGKWLRHTLLLLAIWLLSWVDVSAEPHPLSITGCQCVSPCRYSVYRAAPWCHVNESLCTVSNTLYLNNDPPATFDFLPDNEDPSPSLGLSPVSSNSSMEPTTTQDEYPKILDILTNLGIIIGSFLNLAQPFDNRRLLQSSEATTCRCRQDVLGVWDFCDPLTVRKVVERYNDYELPPFQPTRRRERDITPEPIPLLLLKDDALRTEALIDGANINNNGDLTTRKVMDSEVKTLRTMNLRNPEDDPPSGESESFFSLKPIAHNNVFPSTGRLSRESRCHPSCKTCTRTSKGTESECLSCYEAFEGPDPTFKYHLLILGARSSSRQQGKCIPVTNDPDICHPSCEECRVDCCAKSPRACVLCSSGKSFRPGPHRTIGQCVEILSPFRTTTLPPPPLHPQTNDWNGLISNSDKNVVKNAEGSDRDSNEEVVFPFSQPLHPAVSSWLLRESQAATDRAHQAFSDTAVGHNLMKNSSTFTADEIDQEVTEDNDDEESDEAETATSLSIPFYRRRRKKKSGYDRHERQNNRHHDFPGERTLLLNERPMENGVNGIKSLNLDDVKTQIVSEKEPSEDRYVTQSDSYYDEVETAKTDRNQIEEEKLKFDLFAPKSILPNSQCHEIESYIKKTSPGLDQQGADVSTQSSFTFVNWFDFWRNSQATIGKRYWSQLIYLHADNNILEAGLSDLAEMRSPINPSNYIYRDDIAPNVADYMHLVVLVDTRRQSTSRQGYSEEQGEQQSTTDFSFLNWDSAWSAFTAPLDWFFGRGTKANPISIKQSGQKEYNEGNLKDPLTEEKQEKGYSHEEKLFYNESFFYRSDPSTDNRRWSIPGSQQNKRQLRSISQHLGNIIICPDLPYTDDTTVDLFHPENGAAFEIYRVPKPGTKKGEYQWLLLRRRGEIDMNDPSILSEFISRSLQMFPAQHHSLVLWDHGSAWAGFGDDEDNSDHQNMPIAEIALGIRQGLLSSNVITKFNILGFDACLMNEYSVVSTLSDLSDYFIGSEDNEPGIGWDWRYLTPALTDFRSHHPSGSISLRPSTPFEYSQRLVEGYANSNRRHFLGSHLLTMSVVEIRPFNDFQTQFNLLLKTLYSCGGRGVGIAIQELAARSPSLQACDLIGLCSCIDLRAFIVGLMEIILTNDLDAFLIAQVVSVKNLFDRMIVIDIKDYSDALSLKQPNRQLQGSSNPFQPPRKLDYSITDLTRILNESDNLELKEVSLNFSKVSLVRNLQPSSSLKGSSSRSGMSIYFPMYHLTCPNDQRARGAQREYFYRFKTPWSSFTKDVGDSKPGTICSSSLPSWPMSSSQLSVADPTEAWMIRSRQQIFRVSSFRISKMDKTLIEFSGSAPKTLVASRAFVGIAAVSHHTALWIYVMESDYKRHLKSGGDDNQKQLSHVLFTAETPIEVQGETYSNRGGTDASTLSSNWDRKHFIMSQRQFHKNETTLIKSPLFVVTEKQHPHIPNFPQPDRKKAERAPLSFITPVLFYPSFAQVQDSDHRIAHITFGDEASPLLFISESDGLVRWPRAKGGYIRPVLRVLSFENATLSAEALSDDVLSLSSNHGAHVDSSQTQDQLERMDLTASLKRRAVDVASSVVFDWSLSAPSIEIHELNSIEFIDSLNNGHHSNSHEEDIIANRQNRTMREICGFWIRDSDGIENLHLSSIQFPDSSLCNDKQSALIANDGICDWSVFLNMDNGSCNLDSIIQKMNFYTSHQNRLAIKTSELNDCIGLQGAEWKFNNQKHQARDSVAHSILCGSKVCDNHAQCVTTANKLAKCECSDGFIGDGLKCEDIDECIGIPGPCHLKAICINTVGSYLCLCPAGEVGDGIKDCHSASKCITKSQDGTCTCSPGFIAKGRSNEKMHEKNIQQIMRQDSDLKKQHSTTAVPLDEDECDDIDECHIGSSSCSLLANCINLSGGYICSCQPGHEGDGHICVKGKAVVELVLTMIIGEEEERLLTNKALKNTKQEKRDYYVSNSRQKNKELNDSYVNGHDNLGTDPLKKINLTRLNELLKNGIATAIEISPARVEIMGFSSSLKPLTTLTTQSYTIQAVLRILPVPWSSHGSILSSSSSSLLIPELSSYQSAVELQRQLSSLSSDTSVRLRDASIVGNEFKQLSQKMFIEQHKIFPASSLLPPFSFKRLWESIIELLPQSIKDKIPEEYWSLACFGIIASLSIMSLNCCCHLRATRKRAYRRKSKQSTKS